MASSRPPRHSMMDRLFRTRSIFERFRENPDRETPLKHGSNVESDGTDHQITNDGEASNHRGSASDDADNQTVVRRHIIAPLQFDFRLSSPRPNRRSTLAMAMATDGGRSSSEQRTSPDPMAANRYSDVNEEAVAAAPPNGQPPAVAPAVPGPVDPAMEKTFNEVINSDIGVEILLGRFKQCIAGHRDLATFFKEMGGVYDKHASTQKKVARSTLDTIRGGERKHGQYAAAMEEGLRRLDTQADFFGQFALQCSQMHDELVEQVKTFEDRRKTEKQTGLTAEKRAQGAEEEMMKAKTKRDRLAEDLDRVKTGDRAGRGFGRLGTRSQAQQEEDLNRKLQAADQDYQSKTQNAQQIRQNLLQGERPATVNRLLTMIRELDAAVCLQYGYYVHHMEVLFSKCGRQLLPVSGRDDPWRLANRVAGIDQESDFKTYINSFQQRIGNTNRELRYEPHATQRAGYVGQQQPVTSPTGGGAGMGGPGPNNFRSASNPLQSPPTMSSQQHQRQFSGPQGPMQSGLPTGPANGPPPSSFPTGPPHLQTAGVSGGSFMGGEHLYDTSPQEQRPGSSGGPMQQLNGPSGLPSDPRAGFNQAGGPPRGPPRVGTGGYQPAGSIPSPPSAPAGGGSPASRAAAATFGPPLPANRPSFASGLQTLYERDGTPVPIVVHQCIQAVDLYGLKVDGIYRVSGTSAHIARLRQMFDNDPANVDFSDPENFFHDINSVTGLLKQFFRDLPGGLLTEAFYRDFIQAAKIEDADQRRDALHATINSLPDANYATLRSLCLHLWRVQEHEATNRMTSANLAICFGPTLLVPANSRDLADAGWQVKAMETVFANTMQIFDED